MTALVFLLGVVVVCAVGGLVLWLQHRQPNTLESGMDAFRREMDALAPPEGTSEPGVRAVKRASRPVPPSPPEGP